MKHCAIMMLTLFCSCASAKLESAPTGASKETHNVVAGVEAQTPSGDSTELVLSIAAEKPIAVCTIEIEFDPAVLRLEGIEEASSSIIPYMKKASFASGKVRAMFILHQNFAPKVYLATVRFTRLNPGKTIVSLRALDAYDESAKPVQSTVDPAERTF